ncbi:MAG: RNA polymerase sigma factor [Chlorobi bacterium]|nr:RNA polymerase sigma factor [Chlorobiota bacterium]
MPPSNPEAQLFDQFLAGDDRAFAELFDRHHHRLYLYCLKLVGSPDQAEDIVQEVWERVIRMRKNPQHVLNPTGFLLRITRNLSLNHLRDTKKLTPIDDVQEYKLPTVQMREQSELEELVVICLNKLPLEMREVLILYTYSGYRFDEIAEMMGKSVDAVRMRASRARAQLRTMILSMTEQNPTPHTPAATNAQPQEKNG